MKVLKTAMAAAIAGAGAVVISGTAFATTAATTATASPTASPIATPAPAVAAGAVTLALTCDTGRAGSGTFVISANGKSSTVSVKCGGSSAVSNSAWKAGSNALIHQTVAPSGALRARDLNLTLKATAQSVTIRDFKPVTLAQAAPPAATLAQTGGGLPLAPIGLGLAGLLLATMGTRLLVVRR